MEEAFKKWSESISSSGSLLSGTSMSTWSTVGSTTTGEYYATFPSAPELISMSMTVDYDEKLELKTEEKPEPEPVKPAKPIKRYSKKTFKKKLKELCG